jgi:hypothetical protein
VVSAKYSHCAFTGKVLRFPKMMRLYGYKVIEYSNGSSESDANEHVVMLTDAELQVPFVPKAAAETAVHFQFPACSILMGSRVLSPKRPRRNSLARTLSLEHRCGLFSTQG